MCNLFDFVEYRFLNRCSIKLPIDYCNQLAETAAEYSANSVEDMKLEFRPRTAEEGLCLLLAYYLVLPVDADYIRSILLNKIGRIAHSYGYQGRWNLFQEIFLLPEDEPFDAWSIVAEVLLSNYSECDLFGNLAPKIKKQVKRLVGQRKFPLVLRRKTKIRYPQRKRGYSDHGSRVEPHKQGRRITTSGANPIKQQFEERYPTTKPTTRLWIPEPKDPT